MNRTLAILIVAACGFAPVGSARSAILRVPADYPAIQSAIDAAASSDTIYVAAGQYVESLVLSGKDLLIVGGGLLTVVKPPAGMRALRIGPGVTDASQIIAFWFRDGRADSGGAVLLANGASCKLGLIRFESNAASGGIGKPSFGGALCVAGGGTADLYGCQFVDNIAETSPDLQDGFGGAVYVGGGSALTARTCGFSNNIAAGFEGGLGGAVSVAGDVGITSFEHCSFDSNFAGFGGAINGAGSLEATRCTFSSNSGTYGASAIAYQSFGASLSVAHSVFRDNSSWYAPTIWWNGSGTLEGNTFAYNRVDQGTATPIHGCIELDPSRVSVRNNIIARNDARGIIGRPAAPLPGFVACNDVWRNRDGNYGGTIPDLTGSDGNLSADPLFCDSTGRNLGLMQGSPCVDALCGIIGGLPVGCPTGAVGPVAGRGVELLLASSNPGRPPFTIAFQLDGTLPVRLEIVDVAGRLVALLDDGELRAGRHERSWSGVGRDGRARGPGIYFARLYAGGLSLSRKLVALR